MSTLERRQKATGDRWYVRYRVQGKSRQRVFPTEVDALRFQLVLDSAGHVQAERMIDEDDGGPQPADAYTLTTWMQTHIQALTGVTDGTRRDYERYVEIDIAQTPIGVLPLPALTRENIGAWVNSLEQPRTRKITDGRTGLTRTKELPRLSGKSIKNRHALLSAALTAAVRAGHVPTNHAEGLRIAKTRHSGTEMTILAVEDQNALLDAMASRWRPLVEVLLLTGMRFGEVTALAVKHVDFDAGVVNVRRAWKHVDGGPAELGEPKSEKGRRTVVLEDKALDVLWDACHGKDREDYVFTSSRPGRDGRPAHVRHNTFYEGAWSPAVTAAGLHPRPRIHDLRHTYASSLIALGVTPQYIQRQLGHESIQTTYDVYGHLFPDAREQMRAALSVAYAGLRTRPPSHRRDRASVGGSVEAPALPSSSASPSLALPAASPGPAPEAG